MCDPITAEIFAWSLNIGDKANSTSRHNISGIQFSLCPKFEALLALI